MGDGDGVTDSLPLRRKLTFDSSLLNIPLPALSFPSPTSFSLPLLFFGVIVSKSCARGVGCFLDRVAFLRLCSRLERIRLNGLELDSGAAEDDVTFDDDVGCFVREDEGIGGELGAATLWCW